MKDAPQGWPRITTTIYYKDAKIMIDWLCRAFGFEVQMVVEGATGYDSCVVEVGQNTFMLEGT
jgi:uncharacterized glyoxalase superfamily protein PhnB